MALRFAPDTMVNDLESLTSENREAFRSFIFEQGKELYRDFAWRNTNNPYEIWISEVMLQQTQVSRVEKRWEQFIHRFPTIDALAAADPIDVVEEWQGMGYNRRALALHNAARICAQEFGGCMPRKEEQLLSLPGIGPSTAAGILAFAYDEPVVYLETNVRSVFLHHFFAGEEKVTDKRVRMLVEQMCPHEYVRAWYYALLDYGAFLKKHHPNPSRRSASYTRQTAFEGSRRQKRSWIIREVIARHSLDSEYLFEMLNNHEREAGRDGVDEAEFQSILDALVKEGFFKQDGLTIHL